MKAKGKQYILSLAVLMVLALVFASIAGAAKPVEPPGQSKGTVNQLSSISRQLDRIEARIDSLIDEINDYFDLSDLGAGDPENGAGDPENGAGDPENGAGDPENGAGDEGDNRSMSFRGRLNAHKNMLNAVKNQLNAVSRRAGEESENIQALFDRVEKLEGRLDSKWEELGDIQNSLITEVEEGINVEDLDKTGEDIPAHKEWTVVFNRSLDSETINSRNIIITDFEGNIIEVSLEYIPEEMAMVIIPAAEFIYGGTYRLYLTTNIKSEDGSNLNRPRVVTFTISS